MADKAPTNGQTAAPKAAVSKAKCPICSKPTVLAYRPFCSKRCADVDLGRWLSGTYAIPVTEASDEDGERPIDASQMPVDERD